MKILKLRFKNLNSLYGEWEIDFTNPNFVSNGIFALTGPTGAGKSTILDAICLALYGSTPRLGKITSKTNEIMSRQTGECFSEVLFETQKGRFRCFFGQHRAHKKINGELQPPKHEISEGNENGKIIESKLQKVLKVVEEKTGMDFERFTRSILLAQGGFDSFLKADDEKKSKILEQITGTKIYSEISIKTFEKKREEEKKLALLKAEISGFSILNEKEEEKILSEIADKTKEKKELENNLSEISKKISWLEEIENIKSEILDNKEERTLFQQKIEDFKPQKTKINKAKKALSLDSIYATLTEIRTQQSQEEEKLKKEIKKLPQLETELKKEENKLKESEIFLLKAKNNLKNELPKIKTTRKIDQILFELKKQKSEILKKYNKNLENIAQFEKKLNKEEKKLNNTKTELKTTDNYLKNNSQEKWLINNFSGIEEQFKQLTKLKVEENKIKQAIEQTQTKLKDKSKKLQKTKKEKEEKKIIVEQILEKITIAEKKLLKILGKKLLREYEAKRDYLFKEKYFRETIKKLEEQREKLEDGKECPLCGSTNHPFAKGNTPELSETEKAIEKVLKIISNAKEQEETIKTLEQQKNKAQQNFNDCEKEEIIDLNNKTNIENKLNELQNNLKEIDLKIEQLGNTLSKNLQPLKIQNIDNAKELLEKLKNRKEKYLKQIEEKQQKEKEILTIESEIKTLEALIQTEKTILNENLDNLKKLKKEEKTNQNKRTEIYGNKNPDEIEKQLNKTIEKAETEEKERNNKKLKAQQNLNTAKHSIDLLQKSINNRKEILKNKEKTFAQKLSENNFENETTFLENKISHSELQTLQSKEKELEQKKAILNAKQKELEENLKNKTAENLTTTTLKELLEEKEPQKEKLSQISNEITELKYILTTNAQTKKEQKEKLKAIEKQEKEFQKWDKLNTLIGSSDGKKYRKFAQGLTFELMIYYANIQLQKMTDRYILISNKTNPLELNIIDNYQAGEIRSTKNLSGGESFIISLTLALGLSKMSSKKVKVDSLFLDEGFATLDEEALETALETLSQLHQKGKLIGIISHVSALKERISSQINIVPISGGKSKIIGEGCKKIEKPNKRTAKM